MHPCMLLSRCAFFAEESYSFDLFIYQALSKYGRKLSFWVLLVDFHGCYKI